MTYERLIQIEFNHCDPLGIVFYPRYFEMVNSVIENFFADVVGRSYAWMLAGRKNAVPTVAMEAVFNRPAYLGETVRFTLKVERVGRSSLRLVIDGSGEDGPKLQVKTTLAWTHGMTSVPWPDDMRAAMDAYREMQGA